MKKKDSTNLKWKGMNKGKLKTKGKGNRRRPHSHKGKMFDSHEVKVISKASATPPTKQVVSKKYCI